MNYSSRTTCEVSYKELIDAKILCKYMSWNTRTDQRLNVRF